MTTKKQNQAGARTQHTPWPWKIREDGTSKIIQVSGQVICKLFGQYYQNLALQEANSHLIVAAPELLDELTKTNIFLVYVVANLVTRLPADSPVPELLQGHIDANRAAIAKAEGQS